MQLLRSPWVRHSEFHTASPNMLVPGAAGNPCLACLRCPCPFLDCTPGTYRGHAKGVIVSHDDNGGEVLTSQPCQPSLWRDDGAMVPGASQGSPWYAVSLFPQGRHRPCWLVTHYWTRAQTIWPRMGAYSKAQILRPSQPAHPMTGAVGTLQTLPQSVLQPDPPLSQVLCPNPEL